MPYEPPVPVESGGAPGLRAVSSSPAGWDPLPDIRFSPLDLGPRARPPGRGIVHSRPSSRHPLWNSTLLLVGLTGSSYITTFVRERFFYQRAYGTVVLDHAEVLMSLLAVVSNAIGLLLVFVWVSGRISTRALLILAGVAISAVLAAVVGSVAAGAAVGIVVSFSAWLLWSQKAAAAGRLAPALVGAITAAGPTLIVWSLLGTENLTHVLLGYLVGSTWQAGIAGVLSLGGRPAKRSESGSPWWPLVYVVVIQFDALIDQVVLLGAGKGWAGAAALAYSLFVATVLIVLYPLSSQALAGRLDLAKRRYSIGLGAVAGCSFLVLLPLVLPLVLRGGHVEGIGYNRVLDLSLCYGLAIPFSTYWQLHTRAAHGDTDQWHRLAGWAGLLFVVHAVGLVPVVILSEWSLVPLATVAAFGLMAVLWSRQPSVKGT